VLCRSELTAADFDIHSSRSRVQDLIVHDPSLIADGLAEMEFRDLSRFDDGHAGVFWSEAGGPSPWEMHPDCDEMLQIRN
jgi:hypothetical protein